MMRAWLSQGVGGSPIRTPDQRLRVFVSSTLAELAEERAAVARAIVSLGLSPRHVRARRAPAPAAGALPRLSRAVRHLRRTVLAELRLGRARAWTSPASRTSSGWRGRGRACSTSRLRRPIGSLGSRAMIDELRSQGTDAYRTFRSTRELGRLVRDDLAILLSERFVVSAPESRAAPRPARRRGAPSPSPPRRSSAGRPTWRPSRASSSAPMCAS